MRQGRAGAVQARSATQAATRAAESAMSTIRHDPAMNTQSSHRPPERPAEGHGGTWRVFGVAGLYARHRRRSGPAAGLWNGNGQVSHLSRRSRALQLRQIVVWRAGGPTGQWLQLLRLLDQKARSVKIRQAILRRTSRAMCESHGQ